MTRREFRLISGQGAGPSVEDITRRKPTRRHFKTLQAGTTANTLQCGTTVAYPQSTAQLESDFYYALNTPSDQTFYNPVTGLTMLYTSTSGNSGPLDDIGIVWLRSTSICTWTALRYGLDNLKDFIRRGHTVMITIEVQGPFNCFSTGEKATVDGWLSGLGASDIQIVRDDLWSGCQTITNYAAANGLNAAITTWRTGGSSKFTLTGGAVPIVEDVSGNVLVAGVVSTLTGNTNKGKVIVLGDENTTDTCLSGATLPQLYTNVCSRIGKSI